MEKISIQKRSVKSLVSVIKDIDKKMMSKLLFTHRYGVFIDAENNFSETLNDIFRLENLRFQNPENVIFSYLNINSVCNKFPGLTNLVSEHIDILKVADTKLGASFPTAQFLMPVFINHLGWMLLLIVQVC